MDFPPLVVSKMYSIVFPAKFEPVQEPCILNVRNEPLHDMACVLKRGPPPEWRWKLYELQHGKGI